LYVRYVREEKRKEKKKTKLAIKMHTIKRKKKYHMGQKKEQKERKQKRSGTRKTISKSKKQSSKQHGGNVASNLSQHSLFATVHNLGYTINDNSSIYPVNQPIEPKLFETIYSRPCIDYSQIYVA